MGESGYGSIGVGQQNPNSIELSEPNLECNGAMEGAAAHQPPQVVQGTPSKPSVSEGINDYGTNNQEKGVEEGDLIVSNGTKGEYLWIWFCTVYILLSSFFLSFCTVFAAYGDKIVIWDPRSGKILAKVQMLPVEVPKYKWNQGLRPVRIAPDNNGQSKPLICHLLLQANWLVVIVEGYGATFRNTTLREYPVLHSYMSTHVHLYRIVSKSEGLLQLVSTKNMNGQFMEA